MKTVGRMLTRMILVRFLFILFGISIFVIDARCRHLCQRDPAVRGNEPAAIGYYMLLRAPGISVDLPADQRPARAAAHFDRTQLSQ